MYISQLYRDELGYKSCAACRVITWNNFHTKGFQWVSKALQAISEAFYGVSDALDGVSGGV